jgi:hypothetical protein
MFCDFLQWNEVHFLTQTFQIATIYTVIGFDRPVATWGRLVMSSSGIACWSADRQESLFPSTCHKGATPPRTCNPFWSGGIIARSGEQAGSASASKSQLLSVSKSSATRTWDAKLCLVMTNSAPCGLWTSGLPPHKHSKLLLWQCTMHNCTQSNLLPVLQDSLNQQS